MAHLSQKEFLDAVNILVADSNLRSLSDRFFRVNALVTRRAVRTAEALSQQIYTLTAGLRKQVPASLAFQGIWGEMINKRLGKEGEEEIEELAKAVNECLDDDETIVADKREAIELALGKYAQALAAKVGSDVAYLDMLLKAVPDVAAILREKGLPQASPETKSEG